MSENCTLAEDHMMTHDYTMPVDYTMQTEQIQRSIFDLRHKKLGMKTFMTLLLDTKYQMSVGSVENIVKMYITYFLAMVFFTIFTMVTTRMYEMYLYKLETLDVPERHQKKVDYLIQFLKCLPYIQSFVFFLGGLPVDWKQGAQFVGVSNGYKAVMTISSLIIGRIVKYDIKRYIKRYSRKLFGDSPTDCTFLSYLAIVGVNFCAIYQILLILSMITTGNVDISDIYYVFFLLILILPFIGYHIQLFFKREHGSIFQQLEIDTVDQFMREEERNMYRTLYRVF